MAKVCSAKSWCSAMNEFADDQYGSGKRIFITETMSKNGRFGHSAAYQFGTRKDFVWLNFCPWCSGPAHFPESKVKGKGKL